MGLVSVDELATSAGLTVRTTRYYASLGLLPPPVRRGRAALYGPTHHARLQLVKALREHGYTLAAIERYLSDVPLDASPEELSVQRALLTAWNPASWESVAQAHVSDRAGRPLSSTDLDWLERAGALRRSGGDRLEVHPLLRLAVELRDLGMPLAGVTDADAAVRRHMGQLVEELTDVMRTHVLSSCRSPDLSSEDVECAERTWILLRMLTLDAVVDAFQAVGRSLATHFLGSGPPAD